MVGVCYMGFVHTGAYTCGGGVHMWCTLYTRVVHAVHTWLQTPLPPPHIHREAAGIDHPSYWQQVPARVIPCLHLYNMPVSDDVMAPGQPLNVLYEMYRPGTWCDGCVVCGHGCVVMSVRAVFVVLGTCDS